MADTVRTVDYFSIIVPNTPAKAFGVLSTLVSSGIDLLACIGIPRGRSAQIDVVPADTRRFKSAVSKAGLTFTPEKSGFLIQGLDRPGALTDHLKKLGDSGINVIGIEALTAGEGRWGAIIWVDAAAVRKARQVLGVKAATRTKSKATGGLKQARSTAPRRSRRGRGAPP
jgi:hypothetical protein